MARFKHFQIKLKTAPSSRKPSEKATNRGEIWWSRKSHRQRKKNIEINGKMETEGRLWSFSDAPALSAAFDCVKQLSLQLSGFVLSPAEFLARRSMDWEVAFRRARPGPQMKYGYSHQCRYLIFSRRNTVVY